MTKATGTGRTSTQPHAGGPQRRIVQPTDDGYEVVKPHHERASARKDTKSEAADRAKEIVTRLGGGEVTTKTKSGKIDNSNTVGHGNDPHPPKDRKH